MQLRRYSLRIPANIDDHFNYLDVEVADYVTIISKVARTVEIRSVAFPIPWWLTTSHPTPSARSSLTKATGPERTSLAQPNPYLSSLLHLAAMLFRGLGHQNDGDSLATRRGRESESTSISILLRVSHFVSFPRYSLYPTLPKTHLSNLLSAFLALNRRLIPFLRLILNFVPVFTFRSSSPAPRGFRLTILLRRSLLRE